MEPPKILVVNLGSQYTLVIGRTLQELGYRSAILSPKQAQGWLAQHRPAGIILSGGYASVTDEGATMPPDCILKLNVPILGICLGMQWLAQTQGAIIVKAVGDKHYGQADIEIMEGKHLLGLNDRQSVWMSHGDSVQISPDNPRLNVLARTTEGTIAAFKVVHTPWVGVQFHPEVVQTPKGKQMLQNWLDVCEVKKDWRPIDIVAEIRQRAATDYAGKRVVGGFSGGVDSSTLFAILSPVLKENLLAVCIDGGQLRQDESVEIKRHAEICGVKLKVVEAEDKFLRLLAGFTDAEKKRELFRKGYKAILESEIENFRAEAILQGSLATDFIESGRHDSSASATIKSHHNIGLEFGCSELHPFSGLFKYEVRELARALGLPPSISERQPFPGPGLFVRIFGGEITQERLDTLRWADAAVTAILRDNGILPDVSQLVVALLCTPTVGVKGDGRSYASSIVVRGVKTADFMTAIGYQIPAEARRQISREVTKHPQVVRVFFDETDKPPATTEME